MWFLETTWWYKCFQIWFWPDFKTLVGQAHHAKTRLLNLSRVFFTKCEYFRAIISSFQCDKVDFSHRYPYWADHPSFFWPSWKTVNFGVKPLKMAFFSIFQLCHLKSLNFSSLYHFQWFSGPFEPFFWKNGKKYEFQLFWLIFGKIAPDKPKSHPETHRICQMASFRVLCDHIS